MKLFLENNTPQYWLIVLVFAIALIFLFIIYHLLELFITKKLEKKDFNRYAYKRIYKIALYRDYYLINNFLFNVEETKTERIDHILFADKYIYIINDHYYDGDITGSYDNPSLVVQKKDGTQEYIDNPIKESIDLVSKISRETGLGTDFIIGITLINDDCKCGVETDSQQFYIIQKSKLDRLVKKIESREIANINPTRLANAVKDFDKVNGKHKNERKK